MVKKLFVEDAQKVDINLLRNTILKENILRGNEISVVFDHVFYKVYTPCFSFFVAKKIHNNIPAVGIIIKKKIKLAVRRNLCRRLIKELFRTHQHLFVGKAVIVVARKSAKSVNRGALWKSLEQFINSYRVL